MACPRRERSLAREKEKERGRGRGSTCFCFLIAGRRPFTFFFFFDLDLARRSTSTFLRPKKKKLEMCRLLAYMGPSTLVADVVLWPDRSIIRQSYDARERAGLGNSSSSAAANNGNASSSKTASADAALAACHLAYGNLNGDGFGIGWYSAPGDVSASSGGGGSYPYSSSSSRGIKVAGGKSKGDNNRGNGALPSSASAAAAAAAASAAGGGSGTTAKAAARHSSNNPATNASRADPTPCVFTSVTPAWNNENLGRLARKIASPLVFAHVRAAMPGMAVNEQNCHPFAHGRYLWMHNGVVAGFGVIRRRLVAELSDEAYDSLQSFHSDSSVAFAVFLSHLPDMDSAHPPPVLLRALQATLESIAEAQAAAGVKGASLLNFAVSDGDTLIATRYVSSSDPRDEPASLYYAEGAAFRRRRSSSSANDDDDDAEAAAAAAATAAAAANGDPRGNPPSPTAAAAAAAALAVKQQRQRRRDNEGEYELAYRDPGSRTVLVASEPITAAKGDWVAVPRNAAVVVTREKGEFVNVMLSPLGPGEAASAGAAEVATCLDAVCGAAEVSKRRWRGFLSSGNGNGPLAPRAPGGHHHHRRSGGGVFGGIGGGGGSGDFFNQVQPRLEQHHHHDDDSDAGLEASGGGAAFRAGSVASAWSEGEDGGGRTDGSDGGAVFAAASRGGGGGGGLAAGGTLQHRHRHHYHHQQHHHPPLAPPDHRLTGHDGPVLCLAASGNATGTCGGASFSSYASSPSSSNPSSPSLVFSGGVDRTVRVWDVMSLKCVRVLLGHTKPVQRVAVVEVDSAAAESRSGKSNKNDDKKRRGKKKLLLLSAGGRHVRVHDTETWQCVRALDLPEGAGSIYALCCSHTLLSGGALWKVVRAWVGGQDTTVRAYDLEGKTEAAAAAASAASAAPTSAAPAFFEVEETVATPSARTPAGGAAGGHCSAVCSLALVCCAGGGGRAPATFVCSAGGDAAIRVWSADEVVSDRRATQPSPAAAAAAAAPDSPPPPPPAPIGVLRGHRGSVMCLASVGGGAGVLLSGGRDNNVRVWDLRALVCRRVLGGHCDDVLALAAVPPLPAPPEASAASAAAVAFAAAAVASPGAVPFLGAPQGSVRGGTAGAAGASADNASSAHSFGASSSLFASASADGTVRLWDATLGWACVGVLTPEVGTSSLPPPPAEAHFGGGGGSPSTSPQPRLSPLFLAGAGAAGGQQPLISPRSARALALHPAALASSSSLVDPTRPLAMVSVEVTPPHIVFAGGSDGQLRAWDVGACAAAAATRSAEAAAGAAASARQAQATTAGAALLSQRSSAMATAAAAAVAAAAAAATVAISRKRTAGAGNIASREGDRAAAVAAATAAVLTSPSGVAFAKAEAAAAAADAQAAAAADAQAAATISLAVEREMERALSAFVRLRTVSADPAPETREDCFRGAKWLAALLESLGAEIKVVRPADDDRNPVVLGRLGRDPAKPTFTFYGHYDVQPAQEREWATDPFSVSSVDGYLYGRGTSDNKGPILAFFYAVKELLLTSSLKNSSGDGDGENGNGGGGEGGACAAAAAAAAAEVSALAARHHLHTASSQTATTTALPCNVVFVFEGEEENGSGGFEAAVAANLRWFEGTSAIVVSNTLWVGERVPCLTTGMRGMISASLEVRGPARDLHSGNDGGVIAEPLVDLAKLVATLTANPGGGGGGTGAGTGTGGGGGESAPSLLARPTAEAEADTADNDKSNKAKAKKAAAAAAAAAAASLSPKKRKCPPACGHDHRDENGDESFAAPGAIAVPGFYDDVRPGMLPDDVADALAASGEFSADAYTRALGAPGFSLPRGAPAAALLRRRWCEPALTVADVRVGDDAAAFGGGDTHYRFGPTRSSVIPRAAVATLSVRFVPNQDAEKLVAALRSHVEAEFAGLGSPNSVSLRVKSVGGWWEADTGSPLFSLARRVLAKEWSRSSQLSPMAAAGFGQCPLLVREGGTMPVAATLERLLGAKALLIPFGASSDACHLANERIGRENLIRGKNVIRELLREAGRLKLGVAVVGNGGGGGGGGSAAAAEAATNNGSASAAAAAAAPTPASTSLPRLPASAAAASVEKKEGVLPAKRAASVATATVAAATKGGRGKAAKKSS